MSKSIAIIARHPTRAAVLLGLAIVVALLALVISRMDTGAVHNNGLLELDGNTAFDGGCGFDIPPVGPGGNGCADNGISTGTQAAFDWEDICEAGAGNLIQKKASQPGAVDEAVCQRDFVVGSTADVSYHAGSDKDFQEISSDPAGAPDVWGCVKLNNATNKADLLNAYFVLATAFETDKDHQYLFMGAERDFEHGNVFNGFWFLQNAVSSECPPSTDGNFLGTHVCGDVLVLFNYESGGRIGRTAAYRWEPGLNGCDDEPGTTADDCPNPDAAETHDPLCLIVDVANGDCRIPVGGIDDLCGRVNGETDCAPTKTKPEPCSGPGPFSTPWEPKNSPDQLESPTFSEAGIDLTGLGIELPCIAAFIAETRSSQSVDATLKDYALAPTGVECGSSIRTEIHNVANHGDTDQDIQGSTVDAGTVVHDAAFLTPSGPPSAPNATGTITFERWDVGDCGDSGGESPVDTEVITITVQIPGGIPVNTERSVDSSVFDTTNSQPNISYRASYDADFPYTDSTSACETLNIIYSPDIVTDPDPDEGHVGDVLDDTATLSGGFEPTGSILFELFLPSDPTCSDTPVFSESVPVSGNGSYSTTADSDYTTAASGTYQWVASYSGDTNNNPASSGCGDEPVVIINPSTILTKSATPSVVTTVTYTYTEENDGDVPLTSPTVSDPDCEANGGTVAYSSGDDGNGILDVGETWTFTCTATYNGEGSFTNTATGSGVDPQGFTVTYCVTPPDGTTICDAEERDSRTVTVSVDVS